MSDKIPLEVTQRQLELICASLEAISLTGGGSETYHLIGTLKLMAFPIKVAHQDSYHKLVGQLQRIAHEEYMEVWGLEARSKSNSQPPDEELL